MDFKTFWLSLSDIERSALADSCKTSVGHLRNIAYGKTCGEALAIAIDRESSGRVPVEDLRPDVDWSYLRGTSKPAAPQPSV